MTALGRRLARLLRAKLLFFDQTPLQEEPDTSQEPAATFEMSQEARWLDTLELSRDASHEEIRAAYLRLSKRFHPDRFASAPEKLELANELMQEINRAYRGLIVKKEL